MHVDRHRRHRQTAVRFIDASVRIFRVRTVAALAAATGCSIRSRDWN
jgi:hypothetical protein